MNKLKRVFKCDHNSRNNESEVYYIIVNDEKKVKCSICGAEFIIVDHIDETNKYDAIHTLITYVGIFNLGVKYNDLLYKVLENNNIKFNYDIVNQLIREFDNNIYKRTPFPTLANIKHLFTLFEHSIYQMSIQETTNKYNHNNSYIDQMVMNYYINHRDELINGNVENESFKSLSNDDAKKLYSKLYNFNYGEFTPSFIKCFESNKKDDNVTRQFNDNYKQNTLKTLNELSNKSYNIDNSQVYEENGYNVKNDKEITLNNKILNNNDIIKLLHTNVDYTYELERVANKYASDPRLLELIMFNKHDNVKNLKTKIKNTFKYINVTIESGTILLSGIIDSKYQKLYITDKLFYDLKEIEKIIELNESLYYNLNGQLNSLYQLMKKFESMSPKKFIRYKESNESLYTITINKFEGDNYYNHIYKKSVSDEVFNMINNLEDDEELKIMKVKKSNID